MLQRNTRYFIVIANAATGASETFGVGVTDSNAEDSAGLARWDIGDILRVDHAGSWQDESSGQTILVEIRGTEESNTPATGIVRISGITIPGQTLTAHTGGIVDPDGLTTSTFSYQWFRVDADNLFDETEIGTDSNTYTLVDADAGKKIRLTAFFLDDAGVEEERPANAYPHLNTVLVELDDSLVSNFAETISSGNIPAGNSSSGEVTQAFTTGSAAAGYRVTSVRIYTRAHNFTSPEQVTVSIHEFDDGETDKVGAHVATLTRSNPAESETVTEYEAPADIVLMPSKKYLLDFVATGDAAADLRLGITTSDNESTFDDWRIDNEARESGVPATSGASLFFEVTGTLANEATGKPTISGTAQGGQTLTAGKGTISDPDGTTNADDGDAGYAYEYQWVRTNADGNDATEITGATGETYTLVDEDAGGKVRVRVSFTDDRDNDEMVESDAYPATGLIQSGDLMVGNLAEISVPGLSVGDRSSGELTQSFTTGSIGLSYPLSSVKIFVEENNLTGRETIAVTLYEFDDSESDKLGTPVAELVTPGLISDRSVAEFKAPANVVLEPSTKYILDIVTTGNTSGDLELGATFSDNQNTLDDWTIEDAMRSNGGLVANGGTLYFEVTGHVVNAVPLTRDVPNNWALTPSDLGIGDSFRLIFLSSSKNILSSTDIEDYNAFVQNGAAAGHLSIQRFSSDFNAVGSTASVDARNNTRTRFTSDDKGVPIYWLNGQKVADEYEDFYDGSWDDEANDKNESGNDGPDTSQLANYPATGSGHNGTASVVGGVSNALDAGFVRLGTPNSTTTSDGPLSSNNITASSNTRPMYGLSPVFTVVDGAIAPAPPRDLTATSGAVSQINLSWSAPLDDGGATVTGYSIEVSSDAGANWTDLVADITSTTYAHSEIPSGATYHYRVSAINVVGTSDPSGIANATTVMAHEVPEGWALKPSSLGVGDSFRLLFLSRTTRSVSSSNISDYNTFVQNRAAAGHSAIQPFSSYFRVVGSTAAVDARDNTSTTYTTDDKGLPIYWLNGTKVADDYEDFYDSTWDDEINDKNELGNNGPDTSQLANQPATGSNNNGTESIRSGESLALGASSVRLGVPDSTFPGDGPLSGNRTTFSSDTRHMYALSPVFTVVPFPTHEVPNDWDLIPTGVEFGDSFRLIFLSSTKSTLTSTDISDYNSSVQGRAAAGHTAIQDYSADFRVVGSTESVDARDNTGTTYTDSDKGPAHLLVERHESCR